MEPDVRDAIDRLTGQLNAAEFRLQALTEAAATHDQIANLREWTRQSIEALQVIVLAVRDVTEQHKKDLYQLHMDVTRALSANPLAPYVIAHQALTWTILEHISLVENTGSGIEMVNRAYDHYSSFLGPANDVVDSRGVLSDMLQHLGAPPRTN